MSLAQYVEIENPIRDAYCAVKASGVLGRLESLGLPSIEGVSYMEKSVDTHISLLYLVSDTLQQNNIPDTIFYDLMLLYNASVGHRGYVVYEGEQFNVFDNIVDCERPLLKYKYSAQNPRRCENGMTLCEIEREYGVSHTTLAKRYDVGARTLKELLRGAK